MPVYQCSEEWDLKEYWLSVYLLFTNIDCGYSSGAPKRDGPNEYPQYTFVKKLWKITCEKCHFRAMKMVHITE